VLILFSIDEQLSFSHRIILKCTDSHNVNKFDQIGVGKNPPSNINVVIEIPQNSNIKYEVDADYGILFVDRKLHTSMVYPFNYGFVPMTREEDGDPIDILVMSNDAFSPLSVVRSKPIGVLIMEDEEGQDSKIIAVPNEKIDYDYSRYSEIDQIDHRVLDKIQHFFEHYKELEKGKFVKVTGWKDSKTAEQIILKGVERFKQNQS
jgi:inorganic pyrophosphatase